MQEGHYCSHGNDAYSYATCIRTTGPNGFYILNATKYSKTTSRHQNKSIADIPTGLLEKATFVDNAQKGATADDLRALASKVS